MAQEVQQLLDGGLPHAPPPQQLARDAHALRPLHGLDLPQLGQVCDHIGGWKASKKGCLEPEGQPLHQRVTMLGQLCPPQSRLAHPT